MKLSRKTIVLTLIVVFCLASSTLGIVSAQSVNFQGTVKYINLEGGFWGIVSEEGKNYDPINLAEEFKHEGQRVQVEAVVKDRVGIHMWGTIIEVTAIRKVENSK